MYAYAPDGTPIVSTKDRIGAVAGLADGGFRLNGEGMLDCGHDGGSEVDWNSQRTVVERGQEIVIDADDAEWPVCALVVLEEPLGEDDDGVAETLPADLVAAAEARHQAWLASKNPTHDRMFDGLPVVDLEKDATRTLLVARIAWDLDDEDADEDAPKPDLPGTLVVGLAEGTDVEDRMADLLSDRFGFCVLGMGAIVPLDHGR